MPIALFGHGVEIGVAPEELTAFLENGRPTGIEDSHGIICPCHPTHPVTLGMLGQARQLCTDH
jgi:hypothetical protein